MPSRAEFSCAEPAHRLPEGHGILFVLSGPSGVGKDTVICELKKLILPLHFAVTLTTRAIRSGETDGVNYHFVSMEQFVDLRGQGALLEWAVVHGNYYGTPVEQVREALRAGKHVLLKIDVQGAAKVKERVPEAVFIFLAPPSIDELVNRLVNRGTESADDLARRVRDAHEEMRQLPNYDYVVVNHERRLDEAVERIRCIITAEESRVRLRRTEL